jgi:UDPglucose 6-dehydrogenase
MKLAIVGTGYVGLVSGTCFAESGNEVLCVDIDASKVDRMQKGNVPIYEPGLQVLFERNTSQGRLKFTTDLKEAVDHAEIIFLALPTPPGADGSADLSFVLGVAEDLSHMIERYTIVVNKSTVPVGTGEKVENVLAQHLSRDLFDVVSNPEFLREGVAVDDFQRPDRVVIGTKSDKAGRKMKNLYDPFVRQGNPIYVMDIRSAEMTKYAANSYLATRISFMNEIANLCEKVGANVDQVRIGMGSDSRIGKRFLFPGVGYGGSCFPKDVQALYKKAQQSDYPFHILEAVMTVNRKQKRILARQIQDHLGEDLTGKTIAVWGLAFKPETDDIREAPSLEIIRSLLEHGAKIRCYDPEAMENVKAVLEEDKVYFASDPYDALTDADALAIVTEWSVFRSPSFEKIKERLKRPLIFDGRNLFDLKDMEEKGFEYYSIGRPTVQLKSDQ